MDVVLQAGLQVGTLEVYVAGWNFERAVDEVD